MKSRFLILMMGLLMVLAIGADAYAQATFTVSSGNHAAGPHERPRGTGRRCHAGEVKRYYTVGTAGGSAIIDYGVPITNDVGTLTRTLPPLAIKAPL